jgi:hypothetical protein
LRRRIPPIPDIAVQETIKGHAERPNITRAACWIAIPHLNGNVIGITSTRSVPKDQTVRDQSKIPDLGLPRRSDEDVSWFEIAVEQVSTVQCIQTEQNARANVSNLTKGKRGFKITLFKRPTWTVFHHDVYGVPVLRDPDVVDADNIWVIGLRKILGLRHVFRPEYFPLLVGNGSAFPGGRRRP